MKIITIIMGFLLIGGGVYSLTAPISTFSAIGWLIGVLLLLAGINIIVDFFAHRKSGTVTSGDLISGILTVGLALFILYGQFARFALDAFIIIAFGIWIILTGLLRIYASMRLKQISEPGWIWIFLFGALSVILGIYGMFNPMVFAFAIGWMIGFFFIMQGINLIGFGFTIHKEAKESKPAAK